MFALPKAAAPPIALTGQQQQLTSAGPVGTEAETVPLANVLLVDDNEADIELTQIMLGEKAMLRCNFLVAQDAHDALEVFREKGQDTKVDLMLLDINMPGMSGLERLGQMRAEDRLTGVPVIMCSTSAYDRDITRASELGALGYIAKPTEMTKLQPLLNKAAGLRLIAEDKGYALLRAA